ncbi:ubiquitin carboxyl-terminal hydrolase 2 isoform X1 [Tripterygium wilfordii]|uniref:Ubiquitin carboxyl-terminal hydrolase n=1 Tax=Tripterygium wilfordii TaxID=458696 RepID=A0A7J7E1G9_TRIWF|nr:ubiquitin carboxyl-terminal hydrolase 2-like [Tripterygium wilfordii]KAF5752490.1 ubiquitin carboxyl-terminal hydrolase 2 isoform X1 [Tripterygium wilfordii]
MGKRVKRKARTPAKEKRVVTPSNVVSQQINPSVHSVDNGDSVVKNRKACTHLSKGLDINKLADKIGSSDPVRCEDCREDVADRRTGKVKHGKKKGSASVDSKSESKAIWVCLECGHYACGGVGLPTITQSHAVRHARQTRHTLVIQWDNPLLCWCFPCTTLIPVEKTEGDSENKDILSDVLKLIKGQSLERSPVDVQDVWFGAGSVNSGIKSEGTVSNIIDGSGGYVVRGLVNLGNTCFFNSVMQSLLAMNKLREHFLNVDASLGPLTIALKKLFAETKDAGVKNLINPKSFFGCVCSNAPQFRGYQQHDSHELLRCLLDGLYNEEVGARKRIDLSQEEGYSSKLGPTFVDTVFGGQISSTVCCIKCGHSSTVYEPFLDLSLPVPTKRPTAKKVQLASRAKKTKRPPKRGGKIRQKPNRDTEEMLTSSADHTLGCSSGPAPIADESGSVPQVSSAVLDSGNQKSLEIASEEVALADDFAWLDYLEPETVSDELEPTLQNNDIAIVQDSKENDGVRNDVMTQNNEESSLAGELNIQPGSSRNPWEDEIPMQVQDSEVLLLPYKEEASTVGENLGGEADASSSVMGRGQEEVDFEGIGDLFDEPEISTVSTTKHFPGNEVSETSFAVGNSSESDLDEVDDTDAAVSVESCLAHFIEPELLSDDNAWDCENCAKELQHQSLEAKRKQPKTASKTMTNGGETRSQTDLLQLDKYNSCPMEIKSPSGGDGNTHIAVDICSESFASQNGEVDCWNQNFISIENGNNGELNLVVSQCVEGRDKMKEPQQEQSHTLGSCKSFNQESSSSPPITSCDGLNNTGYSKTRQTGAQLLVEHRQTNGSENKDINSKSVKVKRDATKRVLINKAPHVLTVHLKRFSQDARGRLSKLNGHVSFRETIDLGAYMDSRSGCKEKHVYSLVGVVEHQGTMRGGHYVAYVRGDRSRGKEKESNGGYVWYHANDAHVREVSLEQVLRCEAYILFYEEIRD